MKLFDMSRLATYLIALALPLAATGCGPDPEKAGDECDLDDGCPDGLVCAAGGEDAICYSPPGGTCDRAGPDYCLDDATCSEAGTCLIPLGGRCGGAEVHCAVDTECGAEQICQIPPGGACEPAGPDLCLDDNVCGVALEGNGVCGIAEGGECDATDPLCAGGLVCAEMVAGGFACYPPVLVRGMVFDSGTTTGVEAAHVLALDDHATAITDVAITDMAGDYLLDVPIQRDEDGSPNPEVIFTLRASARDYQTFPGGLRTSLPIKASEAVAGEKGWTIETTLTGIALIKLPTDQLGRPSISGAVLADDESGGVLVVAEDAAGVGFTAISDRAGSYTIFNVPDGSYEVNGYAAGVQLDPATASVSGADLEGIDLARGTAALGTISGSVNIVNAPGGSLTSVVLVVESTFSQTFVRGEVPRGLRTPLSGPPDVTGSFSIADVPAGRYVVLAAFENDLLVRDPDPNIAGTQIVTVAMPSPGEEVALSDSFKITEALPLLGPGAEDPELVMAAPMLRWGDDSSEDFYTVVVYNAYGDLVWCLSDDPTCDGPSIPGVSGSDDVSVEYGGPLEPGMYYQFRATAWRSPGGEPGPISATEDLRGVFYLE
jgi:hypothetical protein